MDILTPHHMLFMFRMLQLQPDQSEGYSSYLYFCLLPSSSYDHATGNWRGSEHHLLLRKWTYCKLKYCKKTQSQQSTRGGEEQKDAGEKTLISKDLEDLLEVDKAGRVTPTTIQYVKCNNKLQILSFSRIMGQLNLYTHRKEKKREQKSQLVCKILLSNTQLTQHANLSNTFPPDCPQLDGNVPRLIRT